MDKARISKLRLESYVRSARYSLDMRYLLSPIEEFSLDLLDARRRIAELEQSTEGTTPYKLFVWESPCLWIVAVHARSVKEARELALSDEFDLGGTDGSCLDRAAARKAVIETTPEIYRGKQGFSMFAEDAERIAELEKDAERLNARTIRINGYDEFGLPESTLHLDFDVRAAIDAAIAAQRQKEGE